LVADICCLDVYLFPCQFLWFGKSIQVIASSNDPDNSCAAKNDYYKSMPSSSNVDDKLADTDAEEEQADFDQE
jgi:hypothetical protein